MRAKSQTRMVLVWVAAIVLLVIAPSMRAVWINAWKLMSVWEQTFWFTPALYVYGFGSLMAIATPVAAAARCVALLWVHDATPRVLRSVLFGSMALAFGAALFWQAVAWASYPLLKDGQLRLVPLYPWPDSSFFREFLRLVPYSR